MRRACWDRRDDRAPKRADITITLVIGADGRVVTVNASGDDRVFGACVARVLATATFPPPGRVTSIDVPFQFVRE